MEKTKCPFLLSLAPIRARLISDWKVFFKFWSVRIDLISAAITTWAIMHPDRIASALDYLPPQIKEMIPPDWLPQISLVLLVLSLIARSIKQPKLKAQNEPECVEEDQQNNRP